MATIKIEKDRFAVQFEGRGADGKNDHFRSFYTLSGKPIVIRQRDTRPIGERYAYLRSKDKRTSELQGIYGSYSRTMGGYLVFVDKLEAESQVFINWRTGSMRAYQRLPIGRIQFLTYGPKPRPAISDVVFNSDRLFIAWISDGSPTGELILSSVDPKKGTRKHSIIARDMGLFTMVSLAHKGQYGLIVCHCAMLGDEDAKIEVFPVRLRGSR